MFRPSVFVTWLGACFAARQARRSLGYRQNLDYLALGRSGILDQVNRSSARLGTTANEPQCSDVASWIAEKRASQQYWPGQISSFKCKLGLAPTSNGYSVWSPGQSCASYYKQIYCLVTNREVIGPVRSFKALEYPSCVEPKLSIPQCTDVQEAIQEVTQEAEMGPAKKASLLKMAEMLDGYAIEAQDEWMFLPSQMIAVKELAVGLEEVISQMHPDEGDELATYNYQKEVGENLGPVWRVLLEYCSAAGDRKLKEMKESVHKEDARDLNIAAAEEGKKECKKQTHMDLWAHYHPAFAAAQSQFESVTSLDSFQTHGLDFFTEEKLWKELMAWAGLGDSHSYDKLVRKKHNLIQTAGDRGEMELQFALALHTIEPSSPAPIGGERRLAELTMARTLRNIAASTNKNDFVLKDALAAADELLKAGELQWVDVNAFNEAKSKTEQKLHSAPLAEKCEAAGLPADCTQQQIHDKMCEEVGLPAGCSTQDIGAAKTLRRKCEAAGLPVTCRQADLDEAEDRKKRCVELGLKPGCTEKDIDEKQALKARCKELGLGDCSEAQADFAEEMMARCRAAGLPQDCTQEDLENVATTTTTSTTVHSGGNNFCKISERTSVQFGIEFSYKVRGRACNKVTCSRLRFYTEEMGSMLSAEVHKRTCICSARESTEAEWYRIVKFAVDASARSCNVDGCWKIYAHSMARRLMPGRRLLDEQSLGSRKHFEAMCIDEHEARTAIPVPGDADASRSSSSESED